MLGEQGDVDALLVHAPEREEAAIAAGFGFNRTARRLERLCSPLAYHPS